MSAVTGDSTTQELKYSEFVKAVENNWVESIVIKGDTITGKFKSQEAAKMVAQGKFNRATSAAPANGNSSPKVDDTATTATGDSAATDAKASASPEAGASATSDAKASASPEAGASAATDAKASASPEAGSVEYGTNFKVIFRETNGEMPEKLCLEHNVAIEIDGNRDIDWWGVFLQIIPLILLIFFIVILLRQSGRSEAFSFGRSRHKNAADTRAKVTFADVAGIEEAKQELAEVVDYLKNPEKYKQLGARIPKGVLLLGSPGTGKTLLGRAVAGEADVPFYYISGSDFVEMFVGVGASRVRDLFEQAKKDAPCIVFMDEIDAVGRQRGTGLGGGHDEREQTLNQLLVEMDGFDANAEQAPVVVLAATNRPDVLDPALLRPGRFDRQVTVDRPDIAGRLAILKVHSKGKPLAAEIDLNELAQRTPGFSGADLENLLNEAALLAARQDQEVINMGHCTEAIDRILMGPERKSRVIPPEDREITAYHEGGHALVARALPHADPVRKITILPRGQALGVTSLTPDQDRYNMTRNEILASITVFMGGRVAEELIFEDVTTGASNDIERATQLARDLVCRYGMNSVVGPLHYGHKQSQVFLGRDIVADKNCSEKTAQIIDEQVHLTVAGCYSKAREILTTNIEQLHQLADLLIAKEVVEAEELNNLFGPSAHDLAEEAKNVNKARQFDHVERKQTPNTYQYEP